MKGCTFSDNAWGLSVLFGDAIVQDCAFARNGKPLYVDGNATLTSSTFEDGGSVSLSGGRSTVTDCRFVGNSVHLYLYGSAVVDISLFIGSINGAVGGGFGSALFRNCAFINNAPRSRALSWGYRNLYVLNCTIVGNGVDVFRGAGGMGTNDEYTSAQVLNSIMSGNGDGYEQTREEDQIKVYGTDGRVATSFGFERLGDRRAA